MNSKTLFLISSLLLIGCTTKQPEQVPACSGNTLRGCQPVVYFAEGSSKIEWKETQNLAWALEKLKRFPKKHVKVTGYTDSVGTAERNWGLSKDRALAVRKYFVDNGIEADRIVIDFKGESDPVCTVDSCRSLNRRAELDLAIPYELKSVDWDKVSTKMDSVKCFLCDEE